MYLSKEKEREKEREGKKEKSKSSQILHDVKIGNTSHFDGRLDTDVHKYPCISKYQKMPSKHAGRRRPKMALADSQ